MVSVRWRTRELATPTGPLAGDAPGDVFDDVLRDFGHRLSVGDLQHSDTWLFATPFVFFFFLTGSVLHVFFKGCFHVIVFIAFCFHALMLFACFSCFCVCFSDVSFVVSFFGTFLMFSTFFKGFFHNFLLFFW